LGDAAIGNPPGRLSLLPDRAMDDPAQLRSSLRRLLELDFDAVLVGDGAPILEGGRERLRDLVAEFGPG
jgi:glyoxylase-like metal-dependent hydrolase (beta-lactamase superfamily II)